MDDVIAIIGAGLIGRAWALSFARGGYSVVLWDAQEGVAEAAVARCIEDAADLAAHGLLEGASKSDISSRLRTAPSLSGAVEKAVHVQENGPEDLVVKRGLAKEILAASKTAVLASSSSALMPSAIFEGLPGRDRALVAHPINPPSLIPAVELVPGPDTASAAMDATAARLERAGQSIVRLKSEIDGFLVNRLQGALLDEAFRLVGEGYADAEDIDICIRDGLALRWALIGPFETIDLNAPGGIADYVARYDEMYGRLNVGGGPRTPWADQALGPILKDRRARLPLDGLAERSKWRDEELMRLRAHKRSRQLEGPER